MFKRLVALCALICMIAILVPKAEGRDLRSPGDPEGFYELSLKPPAGGCDPMEFCLRIENYTGGILAVGFPAEGKDAFRTVVWHGGGKPMGFYVYEREAQRDAAVIRVLPDGTEIVDGQFWSGIPNGMTAYVMGDGKDFVIQAVLFGGKMRRMKDVIDHRLSRVFNVPIEVTAYLGLHAEVGDCGIDYRDVTKRGKGQIHFYPSDCGR